MSDGIVQLQPNSTGPKVDTSELTVGANLVERQRVNIADPASATGLAVVTASNGLQVDVTRVQGAVSAAQSGAWSVTADVGITNGLALDATVSGLQVPQGSTTAGQRGELSLGAVTAAAPAYTSAQSSPLSLTTDGDLRVIGKITDGPSLGPTAPGAAAPRSGLVGGVYNAAQPTLASGEQAALQATSRGALLVSPGVDGFAVTATVSGAVNAIQSGPWTVALSGASLASVDPNISAATSADAPLFTTLAGDPSGDFADQSLLEMLMDDASGLGLGSRVLNPEKRDANGATIASDAPAPINLRGAVGSFLVVDTQGYKTLSITTQALAGLVTASNDLQSNTWTALSGLPNLVSNVFSTALTANTTTTFPCLTRFIRVQVTAAGTATAYLRAAPFPAIYSTAQGVNLFTILGAPPPTAGLAGTLAVGGPVAPGVAPTTNPLLMGAVDGGGLTRRLLSDATGRLQVAGAMAGGVANIDGSTVLLTRDQSQAEGQGLGDILLQVLLELKILNQQIAEIPRLLNAGQSCVDDPSAYRNDGSIFN